MTEEQGTARERLEEALMAGEDARLSSWGSAIVVMLDNLPLVLEAAREAGKAEQAWVSESTGRIYEAMGPYVRIDSSRRHIADEPVWRLLSDPEEQT